MERIRHHAKLFGTAFWLAFFVDVFGGCRPIDSESFATEAIAIDRRCVYPGRTITAICNRTAIVTREEQTFDLQSIPCRAKGGG